MTTSNTEKGWIQDLSERRFLQYGLTYIAVAWGLIQAIDWVVKRYELNHSFVDAALIFFIAFLPATLLFIYNHGRPGHDQWLPVEKIAIPLNLVLAIGVAGFVGYSSAEAEPVTETIQIVDEDGNAKERVIFNRSLSNRLLIFPPKSIGNNPTETLTTLAIAELQMTDLELDNRLLAISPRSIISDMKSKGITEYDDLSFGLKRKLAADRYVDYFIDSEISKSGDKYEITFNLHQTNDGKNVFSKQYANDDLFVIVDGFSADLNAYLYDKVDTQSGVPTYVDLPSNELLTNDLDALKFFVQAFYDLNLSNDHVSALANLDKALALDPNFFMATYMKGAILVPTGNMAEGLKYFEKALENADGQSERTQLSVKSQYYLYQNDMDKATRLAEMWKSLYPQTEEPYRILGNLYRTTGNFGKYKDTYQDAYDQGLKGSFLLSLGAIHTEKDEFKLAERYFQEFVELYPDKKGEVTQLGDLYLKQGKFDQAIEYFENRTIKEEQNVNNHITLGGAYLRKGEFEKAMSSYETGLRKSKIAQDSFSVLSAIVNIEYLKGAANNYVEKDELKNDTYSRFAPSMMVDMQYIAFNTISRYKDCGRLDIIDEKRSTMANANESGPVNWGCIVDYNKALGLEDSKLLLDTKAECADDIAKATGPNQGKLLESLESRIKGEYELAASTMNEFIEENNAPRTSLNPYFAELKVELGEFKEAISLMEKFIETDRSSAESYSLLAKAYKGNGDNDKAKKTIQQALEIWKNADDAFIPAQEAKALLAEL